MTKFMSGAANCMKNLHVTYEHERKINFVGGEKDAKLELSESPPEI
jgi:hypothetical protein